MALVLVPALCLLSDAPTGVRVTAAPGTNLQAGESVTLTCSYTSSLPAPNSYTWYRGDRQLEGSRQEMVLKNITAEQAGEYRCQANNGIGQSRSPPITITVRSTPRVWAPAYILGPAVALFPLLLVGLVGVIAWRKRRSKRQGLSSDPVSESMGLGARTPGPRDVLSFRGSVPTEVCLGSPDGTGQFHIYSQPMNMGKILQALSFPAGQRRSHPMRNSKDGPRIFTASWSIPKLVPTELRRNSDQPGTPLHGRDLKHKEKPSLNGADPSGVHKRRLSIVPGGARALALPQAPSPLHPFPQGHTPALLPPHLFPPPPPSVLRPRSSPLCPGGQEERGGRGKH
ncbi:unnamed protein product [Lepidochelys olivacea]